MPKDKNSSYMDEGKIAAFVRAFGEDRAKQREEERKKKKKKEEDKNTLLTKK